MNSSTKIQEEEQRQLEEYEEQDLCEALGMSQAELEQKGWAAGALKRKRKVQCVEGIVRMVLAHAATGWSLRMVGLWTKLKGIGELSDVGVLYRLRQSVNLLGLLIVEQLQQRNEYLKSMKGVRVKLQDGMVVSKPGSKGTDWRMHIQMELGKMCLTGVQLTDCHGAEGLQRFEVDPEEILLADRGHATAKGIGWYLEKMGQLVVRIGWASLKLWDEAGERLDLIGWLKGLGESGERQIQLKTPSGTFDLRLIVSKLPEDKAAEAREKLRKQARKDGKQVNPNSLLAAGFVILVTNLPQATWHCAQVVWLYRLRWQIELQFKRLKSLLHFDDLQAREDKLGQAYLLGKLLLAILIDKMILKAETQHPDLFASTQRPVSYWRLVSLFFVSLSRRLIGPLPEHFLLSAMPGMQRYLCEPPRKRVQQAAFARQVLAGL